MRVSCTPLLSLAVAWLRAEKLEQPIHGPRAGPVRGGRLHAAGAATEVMFDPRRRLISVVLGSHATPARAKQAAAGEHARASMSCNWRSVQSIPARTFHFSRRTHTQAVGSSGGCRD